MATQLYNFETGSYESVPDEKVQEYILAGGHTFGEDQQVSIVLPNGQGYKVEGKKAAQALSLGAKFESESDAIKREYRQEYGSGFDNALLAFGAGVGRGVTLGLSDAVLTQTGMADPRVLDAYREEFGGLSLTGEIGGAILPAFLTGGTGGAATLARLTPAGAVSLASTKVGQQTAKTLIAKSATDSLLRKTAQAGVSAGVAAGLEGTIYGAGIELSDYVLKDKPKSAEQIISNIGLSGLLGGGLGTALGGGAVLSLGGAKALVQKTVRMIEKVSDSKLVEGFTDTVANVIAKATGEDPATVQRLLKLGKKDQAAKFGGVDDVIEQNENLLKSIRAEEVALKRDKINKRIADRARKQAEDQAIGARQEAFEDISANLERERRAIVDELSEDEISVILEDLHMNGELDVLEADIHELRKASSEIRRAFVEDNLGLIENHALAREQEIIRLNALNEKARITRAEIRGKDINAQEELSEIRRSRNEADLQKKNDLAGFKRQQADFIRRFTEEQIDAGLVQLRAQGHLEEELLDIAKMTKEQKLEFAENNAELMFRKAESDAERAELFRTIQEKMVADRALKLTVSDDILAQREKVKEAAEGARSEMSELMADANKQFNNLASEASRSLDEAVHGMEELNTFFQAGGVTGGGGVKEGFFSQLLPKIGAGGDETTRNALTSALNIAKRLEGVESVLAASDDVFFSGGSYGRLLNNFRARISRSVLEAANKASTSKGGQRIYIGLDDMSPNQLQAAAQDFLQSTGFKSSADANRAIFREVDDLKRRLQEEFYRKSFKQNSPERRAESGLKGIFDEIDDTFLKNSELFGDEAVDMYTEMNSAMSQYLKARGLFRPIFSRRSLDSSLGESKQGAINTVLRNITKEGHSSVNNRRLLMGYLDAAENLQAQFAKYYPKEAAQAGTALVKGKPSAPVSGLKEGFDTTSRQAMESIKRVRDKILRAERNRHSMDAFEAITGQRIHLDEVGDDVAAHLSGYSDKLNDLAAARGELERLSRLRRAIGSDTFEDAKMFSAETKELAAALQKTLKGDKLEEIRRMSVLADEHAGASKELSDLKNKIKERKLEGAAEKSTVLQNLKKQEIAAQSRSDKIQAELRDAHEKVKNTVRRSIEEEKTLLDKIAKEADDLKSSSNLRTTHEKYAKAKLKADRDKKIFEKQREIADLERQIKVNKSRLAETKKLYTKKRKERGQTFKNIDEKLQKEKKRLKKDLDDIKAKNRADKAFDADQIDEREIRLLLRKQAAQDILTNARKGKDAGGLGSAVLAGALGSVPFGLGGGVVTGLAVSMTKPTSFAHITTGMWAMTEATEKVMARGVDMVVDSFLGRAIPAIPSSRVNKLPLFLGSLSALAEADTPGERKSEYVKARERLTTLAQNEELLTSTLNESTKEIAEVAPEMSQELQVQGANVVGYLNEHLPSSNPGLGRGALARSIPPTDAEIRKAVELVELCEDPVNVVCQNFAKGTLSAQEIDMCRSCFPYVLEGIVAGVHEGLAKERQKAIDEGRPVPRLDYGKRLLLDRATGGGTEGTMSGEFILTFNEVIAPSDQGPANQTKGKNFNPLKKGVDRATLPLQTAMESIAT